MIEALLIGGALLLAAKKNRGVSGVGYVGQNFNWGRDHLYVIVIHNFSKDIYVEVHHVKRDAIDELKERGRELIADGYFIETTYEDGGGTYENPIGDIVEMYIEEVVGY